MESPKITYVKAFTTDPEKGNPVVVIEGDVNSNRVLEAVKDAHCSVAAVIDTSYGRVIPVRFFYENGKQETHACGHATLGAAHVAMPLNFDSKAFQNIRGDEIKIKRHPLGSVIQEQPIAELGELVSPEEVCRIMGIRLDQILTNVPTQLVGIPGKQKLAIPLSHETLLGMDDASINRRDFCGKIGATGLFPFAVDIDFADAHARHFPNTEIEDPVCGVGGVALAKYIQEYMARERSKIHCGPGLNGVGEMIVAIKDDVSHLIGEACEYQPLAA